MSNRSLNNTRTVITAGATLLAALLAPSPALALQSLDAFITSAKGKNPDQLEARAVADQRSEEAKQAWARLGPSLIAKASYTRNQREVVVTTPNGSATITPIDQLDATFTLNVPLIDVGNFHRISAADATADAAKLRASATGQDVEKVVTRGYYQVVAAEATLAAAERALATAEETRVLTQNRKDAGAASDLDVERARAAVERAKQVVASAEQAKNVARRSLASLTGLAPSEGTVPLPEDDLTAEPDIASLEPGALAQPLVKAAAFERKAADKNAGAAWTSALVPVIAGNLNERLTNATGFAGYVSTWSLGVSATWTFDMSTIFAAKAMSAQRAAAEARELKVQQAARDELFNAWQEVKAQIAKCRAARAELAASSRAARLARDRYATGAATQLDVTQAERDAFASEVNKIQAFADLAYARALVRITSGKGKDGAR